MNGYEWHIISLSSRSLFLPICPWPFLFVYILFHWSMHLFICLCLSAFDSIEQSWLYWTVLTLLNILDSIEQYLFLSNCLSLAICLCMAAFDSIEQSWVYWTVLTLSSSICLFYLALSFSSCHILFLFEYFYLPLSFL